MTLVEGLLVYSNMVVALVGSGGKTTALYLLARELGRLRRRVVVTATAPDFPPIPEDAPKVFLADTIEPVLEGLQQRTRSWRWCVVARRGPDGAPAPVPEEWLEAMISLTEVDNVLVEADSSTGMPFKGPAYGEPFIPRCARLVVPMVGVEALGVPLDDRHVGMPGVVATLAGMQPNQPVTADVIATTLLHREGVVRGAHRLARIVPVVNRADDGTRAAAALQIVQALRSRGASRIVVARTASTPPVVHVTIPPEERGIAPDQPLPEPLPFDQVG